MTVPYAFGSATSAIPLSQLDSNFNTPITLGNTAIQLGNTVTTLNNMTMANVTISSVATAITAAQGGTGLTASGANGNVLTSNGTTWVSQAASAGTNITNGTSNVTIASANGSITAATAGNTALTIDTSQTATFASTVSATKLIPTGGSATGNGMYLPAANTLGFSTNGTQAMTLDASGNLGVGTTSPAAKLQVNTTNFALATSYATLTSNAAIRTTDSAAANVGGELALGGYNNGTSSPSDFVRLHGKKENGTAGNVSGYFAVEVAYDGGPAPYMFERMRIDSSGNLLVGMTSYSTTNAGASLSPTASSSFYVAGGTALTVGRGTSDGTAVQFNRSGTNVGSISVTTTATAYNTSSDYRLKENVQSMTGSLAKVSALKPVTYTWKADGSDGEGFIAHELAEVCPHAVTGEKDAMDENGNPIYQGIDTSFLVATLTAAIQEQQALIQTLTERITALEGAKA